MPIVWGDIVFDKPTFFSGATAYIRILDVSLADAPSGVVVESILPDLTQSEESAHPIAFSIACPQLDYRRSYALEVHIDVDGDGDVTIGDFISMESYPVMPSIPDVHIDVKVRRIQ